MRVAGPGKKSGRPETAAVNSKSCKCYFQPACLSQALRSRGWDFSHCVMDRFSLLLIFSFMQAQ